MSHVVPDLVQKVLKGQDPLHILGSGDQVRCYTYGGDLARGIVAAMFHPGGAQRGLQSLDADAHDRARAGRADLAQGPRRRPSAKPFRFVSDPPYPHDVQRRVPGHSQGAAGPGLRGDDDSLADAGRGRAVDPAGDRGGAHLTGGARGRRLGGRSRGTSTVSSGKRASSIRSRRADGGRSRTASRRDASRRDACGGSSTSGAGPASRGRSTRTAPAATSGSTSPSRRSSLARRKARNGRWAQADACRLPVRRRLLRRRRLQQRAPPHSRLRPRARRGAARPDAGRAACSRSTPTCSTPPWPSFAGRRAPSTSRRASARTRRRSLPAALRRAFEAAGFVEIRQRCQSGIPYREVAPRLINACLSLYNAADWVFETDRTRAAGSAPSS